jgi:dolichol-phosphate mannosyltransferase
MNSVPKNPGPGRGGKSLSVVIPTYNEKNNIVVLVPQILDVFRDNNIDGEIIIVEDQSTDGSAQVLEELAKNVDCLRVIFRRPPNSLARAWLEGFSAAAKENIVCIDADLCHNPKYFPIMLDKIGEYDLIIGSRYLDDRLRMMEGKSRFAVYASIVAQSLTRRVTGFSETDTSHSFRLFKKKLFLEVKDSLTQEGNVFLLEFLVRAKERGARVTEIPIEYGKRVHGVTKLKVSKEGLRYLAFLGKLFIRKYL